MKKTPRISKYIIPLLLLSTCFSIGFSRWKIYSENSYIDTEIGTKGDDAVAYIKDGSSKTYYTSLEKAIDVANSKTSNIDVWVIPGTVYTLESNKSKKITINKNVTLQLPFQDEIVFDVFKGSGTTYDSKGSEAVSSTIALDNPSTYLKTQITLGSNVELVNNGTINIGGVIGGMGGGVSGTPCGQTCHYYSEILCNGLTEDLNPQITNNGTIKNQGSIASTNSDLVGIENTSGSILKSVLVIGENRGGSALLALGGGLIWAGLDMLSYKCSPFNTVYMPNISTNVKCDNGSTVYGLGSMYGNNEHNQVEIRMYGNASNFLIQSTGGYVISKFVRLNGKKYQDVDFYGDHSLHYLEMKVKAAKGDMVLERTVKTDTVLFPLSYLNDVSFNSINGAKANVTSSQDIKVLPGGKLTIGENVSFSIGNLAVYDSSFVDPLTDGVTYPSIKEDGLFVLSGDASIDNLGGYVTIGKESATLIINKSNSVTSKQIEGNPANTKYKDYVFNAKSSFSSNKGITVETNPILANVSYNAFKSSKNEFYFSTKFEMKISAATTSYTSSWGNRTYTFPTFNVFIADNQDGYNERLSPELSQGKETGTKYGAQIDPITLSDFLESSCYIKIVPIKNCDSFSGFESFNTYFPIDKDFAITITNA